MTPFRRITRFRRQCQSLARAVITRIQATGGWRGPSRTCQIPGLKQLVEAHLSEAGRGMFVEVGAYDGERFSNTSWLADRGWQGIYIEPSREFATLCRLRHCLNRVQVANVAAGAADGQAKFMQVGSLSTMSDRTFQEYQTIPWARQQIETKLEHHTTAIEPLDRILERLHCPPRFDLLVVDVEGFEEQVFLGFSLDRWQPRMLIVELCDVHQDFAGSGDLVESARRVRELIHSAGYFEVYCDAINTVFVRRVGAESRLKAA